MLRELAVRHLKPLLSDSAWQSLRAHAPGTARRDAERAMRQARHAQSRAEQSARAAATEAASARAELAELTAPRTSLTALAVKYGTDKYGKWHRYTPHYETHLGYLRDEAFTLFEIGIGGYKRQGDGGASLRMWKEYFPHAQIIGLDIEDKTFVREDRIQAFQGSQTDQDVLRRIVDRADNLRVVIDDGSHHNAHILATFQALFPLLPDDAHYVIEDTQTAYWPRYDGSTDPTVTTTSVGLAKRLIDDLNYEEYTDVGYEPSYTQAHVVGVHAYKNIIFIDKNLNHEGRGYQRHD